MIIQEIQKGFDISQKAVTILVSHFSEKIHLKSKVPESPSFDPLHGRPTDEHSRITSFCIQSVKTDSSFRTLNGFLDSSRGLIQSYHDIVRQACFNFGEKKHFYRDTSPYILAEYEVMIHKLIVVEGSRYSTKTKYDVDSSLSSSFMKTLRYILYEVSRDISSLTAIDRVQKSSKINTATNEVEHDFTKMKINDDDDAQSQKQEICNSILPILLRILGHFVDHLMLIVSTNKMTYLSDKEEVRKLKCTLMLILTVALSFSSDIPYNTRSGDSENDKKTLECLLTSKPFNVYEILSKTVVTDFNLKNIMTTEICILPLEVETNMEKVLKMNGFRNKEEFFNMDFLQDPIINIDSESSYLTMPWMDHTMGIGLRAGASLLQKIASFSKILLNEDQVQIENEESITPSVLSVILRSLGSEIAAEYARTNFFGRSHEEKDHEGHNTASIVEQNGHGKHKSIAFNGIIQSSNKDQNDLNFSLVATNQKLKREPFHKVRNPLKEEPFDVLPARVVSSLRILSAFQQSDLSPRVWSHILPIIYSLIDSIKGCHQSLGAAVFVHVLEQSTPISFLSSGKNKENRDTVSNLLVASQVLTSGRRPCQDPLSLLLLSKARLKLFELTCAEKEELSISRESVQESFSWVQKSSYIGPGGETNSLCLLITVLLGELLPLSDLLARRPSADGMELGTFGLSVLLPLIRWDSTSALARKVQFGALLSLISHMMSSYPVMKIHGGKIMTELLSCIGRAQRDIEHDYLPSEEQGISKAIIVLAVHVASITYTLCGRRSQDIIRQVVEGDYKSNLVQVCEVIPFCSEEITKRTKGD
jgi:hypothetical protein